MDFFDMFCPKCHKGHEVMLVWTGGSPYIGNHEEDFVCQSCGCEFTAVYRVAEIKIKEGQKND